MSNLLAVYKLWNIVENTYKIGMDNTGKVLPFSLETIRYTIEMLVSFPLGIKKSFLEKVVF